MAFDAGAVVAKIKGDVSHFVNSVKTVGSKTKQEMKKAGSAVDQFKKKMKDAGVSMKATAVTIGAVGLTAARSIKGWVDALAEQERAEAQLAQITRQTTQATDDQIQSLKDQAQALQKVGVVGDEVTIAGQAQLATFALQTDTIAKLTPGLLDMAVKQKGVNATQEDMMTISNLLGKVMLGQVGALSRYGVTLDKTQAELIKTGDESERAAVLAEVLAQNFGGVNEAMRDTTEGQLKAASMAWGDFKELLGEAVAPVITAIANGFQRFSEFLQGLNPVFADFVGKVMLGIAALGLLGGPLLLLLSFWPALTAGFAAVSTLLSAWAAPIALAIGAVIALKTAWQNNFLGIQEKTKVVFDAIRLAIDTFVSWFGDNVLPRLKEIWEGIKDVAKAGAEFFNNVIAPIFTAFGEFFLEFVQGIKDMWEENFLGIQEITTVIWEGIKGFFDITINAILGMFRIFAKLLRGDWKGLWDEVRNIAKAVWDGITLFAEVFWEGLKTLFDVGLDFIGKAWESAWTGMSDFFIGIWEGIKQFLKDTLNWIIDKINGVIAGLNKLKIPGTDIGVNISSIPRLARGAIVTRPTQAVIGDGGEPEGVFPLSKISSFLELGGGRGAMGGPTFIFEGPVSSREAAREMLEDAWQDMRASIV